MAVLSFLNSFSQGPLLISFEIANRLQLLPEFVGKKQSIIVTLVDLPSAQFARLKVDQSGLCDILDLQVAEDVYIKRLRCKANSSSD